MTKEFFSGNLDAISEYINAEKRTFQPEENDLTPLELCYELYATMTLLYGTADRLEFFAGRDHPLLRFLHRYTDPVVGAEYWRLFGPPETAETGGADQSIEAHLIAAKRYLAAIEDAIGLARKER